MNDVLTTQELAKLLRMHPMTVQKWAREGIIPGVKPFPRSHWRFSREVIEKWMEEGGRDLR